MYNDNDEPTLRYKKRIVEIYSEISILKILISKYVNYGIKYNQEELITNAIQEVENDADFFINFLL